VVTSGVLCRLMGRALAAGSGAALVLAAVAGLAPAPDAAASPSMLVWPAGVQTAAAALANAAVPSVGVRGAELVDAGTGAVVWAKAANVERPIGSIAKVMTALLVLKAGNLNQKITVSEAAVKYVERDGASSAGLIAGDVLTARQLLAAMLIPSGCDAAFLLATAYGPGREAFIREMNAMAVTLGMTSTHFSNFDGMPYPTEYTTYSTPADLIKLGEAAMQYPLFRAIVSDKRYYLPTTSAHHSYRWQNTNTLLGSYKGTVGIKTGDTKAAGNCLLFEARRDGVTLIGAVLHASPTANPASAINVARQLLTWGFTQT
jgi:serine-type D-Ala-D-Ala carboxypeptidase (penicillin-binding protein 5/6)